MTQVQLTATVGPEGQLTIQYDPQQLSALGLQDPPDPTHVTFQAVQRSRPSFQEIAGKFGELEEGAVQFVRDLRDEE